MTVNIRLRKSENLYYEGITNRRDCDKIIARKIFKVTEIITKSRVSKLMKNKYILKLNVLFI